jgi:hypothetical protein
MAELEEEEAGCFRDQMAKKRGAHVSPINDLMYMIIWRSCS